MKNLASKALRQIEASVASGIWEAHRGCAALAGVLLMHGRHVTGECEPIIKSRVHSLLEDANQQEELGGRVSFDAFKDHVVHELAVFPQEPRELGHDVIYGAYVLRALDVFDIEPPQSLLAAVVGLIRKVKDSGPGWISVNGRNEVRPIPKLFDMDETDCWTRFVQLERPRSMEIGDMQLGHNLTHGHALHVLRSYAHESLIADMDLAHRRRTRCLRDASCEEGDRAPLRNAAADPRREGYWTLMDSLGDMHGHVLKYAYSFLDLKRGAVSPEDLQAFGRIVWPQQAATALE